MSNIDSFDEYAGQTLGMLYEAFPVPIDFNISQILGCSDEYNESGLQPELDNEATIAAYSVKWLFISGYLRMSPPAGDEFFDVVLTEKGLETLKATPASLSEPLGKKINAAVKSGGKEMLRTLTNQALAAGIKIMTNT